MSIALALSDDIESCPACAGPLVELGTLGARKHFRCRDCGLDASQVAQPATVKKTRTKTRIPGRARFDRAGGAVDGMMIIDKELGTVTVREKGAKKSYTMTLAEVVDTICLRGMFGVRGGG